MIEKLANNNIYFSKLKDKIRNDSAKYIQNYWRSISIRFRKYRNAIEILTKKKKLKILLRWLKLCKSNKKPKNKRVPSKPQPNLDTSDGVRKSITSDISAVKFLNTNKRRMTNIKGIGINGFMSTTSNSPNSNNKCIRPEIIKLPSKTSIEEDHITDLKQDKTDEISPAEEEIDNEEDESDEEEKLLSEEVLSNFQNQIPEGDDELDRVLKDSEQQNNERLVLQESEIIPSSKCISPKMKVIKNINPKPQNAEASSLLHIESDDKVIKKFNSPRKKAKSKKKSKKQKAK